jgi:uncharacterized protein
LYRIVLLSSNGVIRAMKQRTTKIERISAQIKRNPVVASLIVLGTVVIAVSSFTDATRKLFNLLPGQSPGAARAALGGLSLEYTPAAFLHSAETGDLTAVKLFLTAGMNPNTADDDGTALMHAAYEGRTEVVAALLKAGADVNQEKGSHTALRSAASGGHIDTLRVLLGKGPNAEAINGAFVEAVRTRHLDCARLLADKGATVKEVGSFAMAVVAKDGWGDEEVSDTVKFLLALGADPNGKDAEGITPLMQAADSGYPATVRLLLDRGADADGKCACPGLLGGGWTALLLATNSRRREVVESLLGKVADVNQRNNRGETALILAAYRGDMQIFRIVLDAGADVHVKSRDGKTPLLGVAAGTAWPDGTIIDHPDAVSALLAKGADVNASDAHRVTPLMLAAQSGSTRVARALLQGGAHANDRDVDGNTALSLAQKDLVGQRRAEMVRLLRQAEAK